MKFVEEVKAYAVDHYEQAGWDILVETYADDEIAEIVENAIDSNDAINIMREHIAPISDYRAEIKSTVW